MKVEILHEAEEELNFPNFRFLLSKFLLFFL